MLTPKFYNPNDGFIQQECTANLLTYKGALNTVVDIGAHVGFFTFAAIGQGAKRVFSFEPTPTNYNKFVASLYDAGLLGHVIPIPLAVGGVAETVPIGRAGHNDGQHGLMMGKQFNSPFIAQVVTIDQILPLLPDRIDYLKMDIEGAEYGVFDTAGGWELLARTNYFEIELHDPDRCTDMDRAKLPVKYREDSLNKLVDDIQSFGFSENGESAKLDRHIKSHNLRGVAR